MAAPAEIVSSPARLQISLALMIDARLVLRQLLPNIANVSYSGLCAPTAYWYSPVPAFIWPPQAIGHRQHPHDRDCWALTASAAISLTSGKSVAIPPQFR